MGVVNIKNALVAVLQTVSNINTVIKFDTADIAGGYPQAQVVLTAIESQFGDTGRDLRNYTLRIRIHQERTEDNRGKANAETVMDTLVDSILTALDADQQLSLPSEIIYSKPLAVSYGYDETGSVRTADIVITVQAAATVSL